MRFFVLFAFALAGSAGWTFSAEPLLIEVAAEKCDRKDVPASCELPKDWATKALLLTDVEANQAIACQVQTGSPLRLFWMLDELPKGATRRYRIEEAAEVQTPEAAPMVSATEGERDLLLSVQGKPVLKYQHAVMSSDDPAKPFYKRSGFIHPIYDPLQRELTEAMPPDHMHQHGIMFAWVNAEFEGRKVDFWNSHKEQGEVRHAKLVASHSGPVFASFSAQLEHLDDTAPGGPKVALNETWEVRVYNRANGYLIDWKSTLTCASDQPIKLNKNDYGGLCVRGNPKWLDPAVGEFLTSDGKTRRDGNHTRPRWCDLSGELEGGPAGLATFCKPSNFRFPQPVRLHPTMPYHSYSPVVLGAFAIEPGVPYVSEYRFFAHSGKPDVSAIESLWEDYAQPVATRVVK